VRNPMGAMSSALQFIAGRDPADPESSKLMGVALRESERLNSIITNFLAYAQPRAFSGSIAANEEMDVVKAIGDCLALLRHDPQVRDEHVFDLNAPAEPVMMRGDESQFRQIIWNLLRNSITAMPEGGRVSIDVADHLDGHLRVIVADNGCGISPEEMPRIFEPFQSGSNGTGLGLSIVHRLVTERGGRIDVTSEPNSGTSFFVDLPKN
jgi:signal transduction histidine kinase